MKIGIMTFHKACNMGAVLQAYALCQTINNIGSKCEIIDYKCKHIYNTYKWPFLKDDRLLRIIKTIFTCGIVSHRNRNFKRFVKKYIKLSKHEYLCRDELSDCLGQYDRFIVGSDQVWSNYCADFDPAYFLDFVPDEHGRKYSYAASFGFDTIPDELKEEYYVRLHGFDRISVRETSAARIIKELVGKNTVISLDPTLLLNGEQWIHLSTKIKEHDYILVYYVEATEKVKVYARQLAQRTGYRIICVHSNRSAKSLLCVGKSNRGIHVKSTCSVEDYLGLFQNAKYVLTNSFHGTAFSILFHKQFLTLLQLENGKLNIRAKELIASLGLENRELTDVGMKNIDKLILWELVENKLSQMRTESLTYLKEICG